MKSTLPTILCNIRSTLIAVSFITLLSGCSNLSSFLFFPHQGHYETPEVLGVDYRPIQLESEGFLLSNWLLLPANNGEPNQKPKATILYLHGNGENISTHMRSVAWLTLHGYQVFLLDYRGYGESEGASTLRSTMFDIRAAHRWISAETEQPILLFGQSMGGALGITYAANYKNLENEALRDFRAVISESSPANWPQAAREAMRKHWLTWIVQVPASLIESDYNAEDHIGSLNDLPVLLMHSKHDQIVDYRHFEQLREKAKSAGVNVTAYQTNGNHTQGLAYEQARARFLDFVDAVLGEK